jgi:hypothetical protein
MALTDEQAHEVGNAPASPAAQAPKIFINYRRQDARQEARLLYLALEPLYGAENVFYDRESLKPGMQWLDEIKASAQACGICLALIGPRWSEIVVAKEAAPDDIAKLELETVLQRPEIDVLQVNIDGAFPDPTKLPPSLSRLPGIQGIPLRDDSWPADMERLLAEIDQIATTAKAPPPPPPGPPPVTPTSEVQAPLVPAEHYEKVLDYIVEQGSVVPILGSGINASDRETPYAEGCGSLPDADELARDLARRWKIEVEPDPDLPRIAQYVAMTDGWTGLASALTRILGSDCAPSSVHRFFATLPARLEELELPKRYQLIVTTNYDNALEEAFRKAGEPFDLVVYMASGTQEERGKFLHVPWEGDPGTIDSPNDYSDLPIHYGELKRTVIVKIHGAVEAATGRSPWEENYVVTEDHYIDYLRGGPVVQLVPGPILKKLQKDHCLFLGYTMSDWNLRVFLRRIWEGRQPDAAVSWAVEDRRDMLERRFWTRVNVELFDAPLAGYVSELAAHLEARRAAPAEA